MKPETIVLKEAHESPLSIHPGSTKMYQDLRQRFWWTRMKREIAQYIANCDVCRRVKAEHQRPAGTLQPLAIPEWKWDKVGMDFITGFPRTKRGNNAIFVVIDRLSKWLTSYLFEKVSLLVSLLTYTFLE